MTERKNGHLFANSDREKKDFISFISNNIFFLFLSQAPEAACLAKKL